MTKIKVHCKCKDVNPLPYIVGAVLATLVIGETTLAVVKLYYGF